MPFFRPLKETAPGFDENLHWPIGGLTYVIMFCCPFMGSVMIGSVHTNFILGIFLGMSIGALVTYANGLLFDHFLEAHMARLQPRLKSLPVLVITNILGFTWAVGVSAVAMFATAGILLWAGVELRP